jgi:uncharacterized protein YhaN
MVYLYVFGDYMSVVSVKVRGEVREKMKKYANKVNWAQEIREAIEERLKQLEAEENFKVVLQELENAKWSMPKGFSAASVREDRDSG